MLHVCLAFSQSAVLDHICVYRALVVAALSMYIELAPQSHTSPAPFTGALPQWMSTIMSTTRKTPNCAGLMVNCLYLLLS